MVKMLAKMFRTVLDSDKKNHKVQDELENIRSYISLQNIRFDNVITLEEEIEPELFQAKMMSILFQPVVENCFKYGSKESGVPIHISIKGELTEDHIMVFTIRDNGQGMSKERLEEVREELIKVRDGKASEEYEDDRKNDKVSHRIGLRNIVERIRLRYGNEGSLKIISSDENGTVIEIRIPYTV